MNKVELLGRLVKDVEIAKSKSGNDYAKFTLAVNRKQKDAPTDFFNCIAFGKLPEIIKKYTEKGNRILIVGTIQNESYKDNEGNTKYSTSVIVEDFYFVDFKKELSNNSEV